MSTISDPRHKRPPLTPEDPYYYGFRDEPVRLADGSHVTERIPLTLEDHLHPHEGDRFMEDSVHYLACVYLFEVFRSRLAKDPTALVLSNTGIYWDDLTLGHHGPDVAVIRGIRRPRDRWTSFHVAEEGVRPRLIVEVVSPRYRANDVEDKVTEYHQADVPRYIVLDRPTDDAPFTIQAYERRPHHYVPWPLDDDGRLWVEELNLWLAVDGQRVRCFDASEQEISDYVSMDQQRAELHALAQAEKARADAAEAQLQELRAELARLQPPPPA